MGTKGKKTELTNSIEYKHQNLVNVYRYVYGIDEASISDIALNVGISIPTVATDLNELEEKGLVFKDGVFKSTGGRSAKVYKCNKLARISIGVELLKESLKICAVDIYGTILKEDSLDLGFSNEEGYFKHLGSWINSFISSLPYPVESILGVNIAIQGLISSDGECVTYSEILKCGGTKLGRFQEYIDIPCSIVHDTEAAAFAEVWHNNEISNAVYIALNRYFGGTLILNNQLFNNRTLSSGAIEHMCLDPNGPLCYCGKHGCIETICSVNHLLESSDLDIDGFFSALRSGNARVSRIWDEYLKNLARALDNIRLVVNCDFIIGGYLFSYMIDNDFDKLVGLVNGLSFDGDTDFCLRKSIHGAKAPMIGAAIALVDKFLNSI